MWLTAARERAYDVVLVTADAGTQASGSLARRRRRRVAARLASAVWREQGFLTPGLRPACAPTSGRVRAGEPAGHTHVRRLEGAVINTATPAMPTSPAPFAGTKTLVFRHANGAAASAP